MRILLADDHPLILAGLREVLGRDERFEVVAETTRADEILPLVVEHAPDLVLLDDRMPGLDSFACVSAILHAQAGTHVVMMSSTGDPLDIQTAFRCGASGVVLKSIDPRDIGPALVQSVERTAFHAHGLPAIEGKSVEIEKDLTPRELDILRGVSGGRANRAIAERLGISEPTVKFHLSSIYRKLGLANRTEAARWAIAHGLQDLRRAS
jgi:DNA-binding NarL/FixJ family response regulator